MSLKRAIKPVGLAAQHAEDHAAALRQRANLGPGDRLDPRTLTSEFGLVIAPLDDIAHASKEDLTYLTNVDPKVWSGMGCELPDNRLLVLLHPKQTVERATVTIMEEVAHRYFGHQPSQLVTHSNGLVKRMYNEQNENEAYWTAAAALLPAKAVALSLFRGNSAEAIASQYGASLELVLFRIKVLGLWRQYQRRAA